MPRLVSRHGATRRRVDCLSQLALNETTRIRLVFARRAIGIDRRTTLVKGRFKRISLFPSFPRRRLDAVIWTGRRQTGLMNVFVDARVSRVAGSWESAAYARRGGSGNDRDSWVRIWLDFLCLCCLDFIVLSISPSAFGVALNHRIPCEISMWAHRFLLIWFIAFV